MPDARPDPEPGNNGDADLARDLMEDVLANVPSPPGFEPFTPERIAALEVAAQAQLRTEIATLSEQIAEREFIADTKHIPAEERLDVIALNYRIIDLQTKLRESVSKTA